jgi:hypothetical protein
MNEQRTRGIVANVNRSELLRLTQRVGKTTLAV